MGLIQHFSSRANTYKAIERCAADMPFGYLDGEEDNDNDAQQLFWKYLSMMSATVQDQ